MLLQRAFYYFLLELHLAAAETSTLNTYNFIEDQIKHNTYEYTFKRYRQNL